MQNIYRDGERGSCCPTCPERHRALRLQPSLQGWMGSTGALGCVLGTGIGGEGHLCPHRPCHTPALLGFLSGRWRMRRKVPAVSESLIVDFAPRLPRKGHCLKNAQLCLDPFCASFCTKGKEKYLFTHTQEPGWAVRPLETQQGLCTVLRLLWAVKKAQKSLQKTLQETQKSLQECAVPLPRHKTCG